MRPTGACVPTRAAQRLPRQKRRGVPLANVGSASYCEHDEPTLMTEAETLPPDPKIVKCSRSTGQHDPVS